MITGRIVTIGDLGVVENTRLTGGLERKAAPAPVQRLPSTADTTIAATSVLNGRDLRQSSWAFVSKTHHANLTPIPQANASRSGYTQIVGNWNGGGRLNA
jgi:hypothetical protein